MNPEESFREGLFYAQMTFSYLHKFNEWGSLSVFMFSCRRLKSFIIDDINDDLQDIWSSVLIHWTWRVQIHEKIKQIHNSWFWCVLSPSDSHQFTLDLNTDINACCVRTTERLLTLHRSVVSWSSRQIWYYHQVLCRESVWTLLLGAGVEWR